MRKAIAVLVCVLATSLAHGQLPSSTLNGRVTDPQGLRVSGARVTVTNLAQGLSRETQTNAKAFYYFLPWKLERTTCGSRVRPSRRPRSTALSLQRGRHRQSTSVCTQPAPKKQ